MEDCSVTVGSDTAVAGGIQTRGGDGEPEQCKEESQAGLSEKGIYR